jgi:two-component sensor histidine kinase
MGSDTFTATLAEPVQGDPMTAACSDQAQDPQDCLGAVLDQMTAAATHDELLGIATRAAVELGGVDGLFLLPDRGERQRAGLTLVVPLPEASGHTAVVFFWHRGRTADGRQRRRLELLARALGLATRMWRREEKQAQQLRDERHAAAELQHRLRNSLALMRSIVRRSNETAESAEQFALHLDARIGALARTQGLLSAAGADGVELEDLVRTELIACAVPEERCSLQGPSVRLHAKAAQSLGLAVHELATNSLKFGALAAPSGMLAVRWAMTGAPSPRLQMSWIESGVTIVSAAPRRRGFGQELIECTLPYELDAHTQLTFDPGGVRCTIDMPLAARAAPLDEPSPQAAGAGMSA